jgi:transketolase
MSSTDARPQDAATDPTIPGTLEEKAINTLRMLSVDMVENARSGHPGLPLGAAAFAYVIWTKFLQHNPKNPAWPDRDRFVLSAGHGSALLYSLLHLTGYELPMAELKRFRQWGSRTPGHPETGLTPGVECTTGPLGQGFANGVGMALAERYLADRFNVGGHRIVDHYVYAIVSDGDLMEGVASEAASLAGHMRLGKLVYLYDDNLISLDGPTSMAFTEDVAARFEAYGWHVQKIDGMVAEQVTVAIEAARGEETRPSLICARTHIGYGSPKQDTHKAHGEPLGAEAMAATKDFFGWPKDRTFYVPPEVLEHFREAVPRGEKLEGEWQARLADLARTRPEAAKELGQMMAGQLPEGWDAELPRYKGGDKPMATRKASGETLQALAKRVPGLVGGSADLATSNNTQLKGFGDLGKAEPGGRNLNFGVREHAMGSISNGLALHGGIRPYTGTFLVFSDYMRPAIRLAALSEAPVVFVFTHDSVGLGEDGPTHQPVEQLMALRAIPNLTLIRPGDAAEAVEAWRAALLNHRGPTILCFTRQDLPIFDRSSRFAPASGLAQGAYVLADSAEPELILIATGSEVQLAVAAWERLQQDGIGARVVSMPSWELFRRQDREYRERVLRPDVPKRLSIEAGVTLGWREWVGPEGDMLGLDRFGASAPLKDVMAGLGFSVEEVLRRCRVLLGS